MLLLLQICNLILSLITFLAAQAWTHSMQPMPQSICAHVCAYVYASSPTGRGDKGLLTRGILYKRRHARTDKKNDTWTWVAIATHLDIFFLSSTLIFLNMSFKKMGNLLRADAECGLGTGLFVGQWLNGDWSSHTFSFSYHIQLNTGTGIQSKLLIPRTQLERLQNVMFHFLILKSPIEWNPRWGTWILS